MKLLGVNYHYFAHKNEFSHGIYPVTTDFFVRQLKELGKYFIFVSAAEIVDAVDKIKPLPENSCIITMDDGLRCQYDFALPILEELGIPAIFFSNTYPLSEKKAMAVHKMHWCRAHFSPTEFYDLLLKEFENTTGEKFDLTRLFGTKFKPDSSSRYDTPEEAKIKYIFNRNVISREIRSSIINKIFSLLVSDERKFVEEFYFSAVEIMDLYDKSFLGFHGHAHEQVSSLGIDGLRTEFTVGQNVFKEIVGDSLKLAAVSYPFGTNEAVSKEVQIVAKEFGFRLGFTMERALNTSLKEPFFLARIDTNDALLGKRQAFEIVDDVLKVHDEYMAAQRFLEINI